MTKQTSKLMGDDHNVNREIFRDLAWMIFFTNHPGIDFSRFSTYGTGVRN
jgi:hypothetical protein